MFALLSLLVVIAVSILITRVAKRALVLTGVSPEVAHFQARSALSGTGFTTGESEQVVAHPARRRIIMLLILLQNAGLATAVATLVLSFVDVDDLNEALLRAGLLVTGLALLVAAAHSGWLRDHLGRMIEWALDRYTDLEPIDYHAMLRIGGPYTVSRFRVAEDAWITDKTLEEAGISERMLILGIERSDGGFVGSPRGGDRVTPDDTLILYGPERELKRFQEKTQSPSYPLGVGGNEA